MKFKTKIKLIISILLVVFNMAMQSSLSVIIRNNLAMMQFQSSNSAYLQMKYLESLMNMSWMVVGLIILIMFAPSGIKVLKSKLTNIKGEN